METVTVSDEERELVLKIFRTESKLRNDYGWDFAAGADENPNHKILLIEADSSGIHEGFRDEVGFWIPDERGTWPSSPILFRPIFRTIKDDRSSSEGEKA
jgi:hypothetical protein